MRNSPKRKKLQLYLKEERYDELQAEADRVGVSLVDYATILMQPCQNCGSDKVHIELLKKDLRKISNGHSVHLIVYLSSRINSGAEETDLSLSYVMSGMLQVDTTSIVYTPKGTHRYVNGKTSATITVFKNNFRQGTVNCIIKGNIIHPTNENL